MLWFVVLNHQVLGKKTWAARYKPNPLNTRRTTKINTVTDPKENSPDSPIDLAAIETDLADVEIALSRLEAGTYWICEVTGQPLSDELLSTHPTARRQ